ncbi:redoxin family protein [Hydrogenophaga sp. 2FB]|uniref:redoxin family protein n=1 Tax=Hydrogenophaga sp. 2FB TaxID=2502187 RepID=UPI0010F9A046|nr:redoxin family protein [Hydrogenophaga sp. 2FB]
MPPASRWRTTPSRRCARRRWWRSTKADWTACWKYCAESPDALRGTPVGFCPVAAPALDSVTRLSRDGPVLTIAMQSGQAEQVARVLNQRQLPWATALDPRGEMSRQLGFKAVPAFVVVDADGHLRAATVGYTSEIGMRLRLWWARLM